MIYVLRIGLALTRYCQLLTIISQISTKARGTYTTAQENIVMLRLAEQFLIRAEARAVLNDLNGALADLNFVRTRAGLPASAATTKPEILGAIQRERRVELFIESGHRYF